MQDGSVSVEHHKRGPDVWSFRWREAGPDGRKVHRRIVLGRERDSCKSGILDVLPVEHHLPDVGTVVRLFRLRK